MGRRTGALAGALIVSLAAAAAQGAGRPSFEDLVANLKSPNASTRQEAAAALGKSRRKEAVAPLAAVVRDPEAKVRVEAVRSLRELRDPTAVPALISGMGDLEVRVREEALSALVEIYAERERVGPVGRFLEIFSDEYHRSSVPPYIAVDPGVLQAMAAALRDPETEIRREAALSIGILNGTAVMPALLGALQDPAADVRAAAATGVGKIGTAQDGRALVPLLADADTQVRNRALQAIGVLHVKEAGPALRQLYEQNTRKEVGIRALAALSRLADPAHADLFEELLQDPDPERKRLAIEALGRLLDASRLPAFKKDYQREKNDDLRLAYTFALTRLGDRAFLDTIILSLPSRTLGARSRDYLLEMGRDVLPDLYPYLTDPDASVRAALCDVIAVIGDGESVARLAPLINDPSQDVADRANRAVERLRRGEPAPGR